LSVTEKLKAKIVCTGHGSRSTADVLHDQQTFFAALREQVGSVVTKILPEDAKAKVETIRSTLK
jgi:hypothetical protein